MLGRPRIIILLRQMLLLKGMVEGNAQWSKKESTMTSLRQFGDEGRDAIIILLLLQTIATAIAKKLTA